MKVLNSKNTSLVISLENKDARLIYLGPKLKQPYSESELSNLVLPPLAQAGLDEIQHLSLASTYADGTYLNPSLKCHRAGQDWVIQWTNVDCVSEDKQLTLSFNDCHANIRLNLRITIDEATDTFCFETSVTNTGKETLELTQLLTSLPVPSHFKKSMHFSGRWVNEFQPIESTIPTGTLELTNLKGRTSQDHFPGLLLAEHAFRNESGECYGMHLGWSGNHTQRIERNQLGLTQYQAGIYLMPGEALLTMDQSFHNAPLYVTTTQAGLAGISENFQKFVRTNILTFPTSTPRPIHINTWEAVYFDHNQEGLDALAQAAHQVGAERFVLDDGWFKGRRDDTTALGDWVIDQDVYPEGFAPLVKSLSKNNLEFGLWFEPEMVSTDSDLFRAHPDWVLAITNRHQPSGRNQWVLDMSNPSVVDFLFTSIGNVLKAHPIRYIKWDMNRDLLQAGDYTGKAAYADYVHGLYNLLARIRTAFPNVEIESCSSGGGRMDFGILKHTHRFWLSDCNDALERQRMQQWASLFFPAEVLGSHIGPDTSHTTRRTHSMQVRAATALFCHLGIECDLRQLNQADQAELTTYLNLYKDIREDIHSGIRVPLTCPDENQIGFFVKGASNGYISIFQKAMPEFSVPGFLRIPYLIPDQQYQIKVLIQPQHTQHLMKKKPHWLEQPKVKVQGEWLMNKGLPLPVLDPETILILKLEACD
ncbi:alpha-galactosidase [Reinekea marina]|uniref:Alpha-galactosidase n=1 Tax=Reinekea marina TaxID=1310421 RepID=A0ABV7WVX7_9GAMM|nr:alpha-galactosidase [Reinekea marina]MDN3649021.1 alpha-galactosidase [Reinekea marina]